MPQGDPVWPANYKAPKRVVNAKPTDLPFPKLEYRPTEDLWYLLEDYVTPEYTVPAGEYTDGCSRPEWAEIFGIKRFDRHLPACIVHDWMYHHGIATRDAADDLLELNLIRCHELFGFDYDLISPMVTAVRIGGAGSYHAAS